MLVIGHTGDQSKIEQDRNGIDRIGDSLQAFSGTADSINPPKH
jgi:hypothetical protein